MILILYHHITQLYYNVRVAVGMNSVDLVLVAKTSTTSQLWLYVIFKPNEGVQSFEKEISPICNMHSLTGSSDIWCLTVNVIVPDASQ